MEGAAPGPPPAGTELAELARALAALVEPPAPGHAALARALGLPEPPTTAEHTDLFQLNLHPWASVHLGAEGMLGGEARDRVAGFWRAVGLTPPPEPDHLGALLGLLAALEDARAAATDPAEAALLGEAVAALLDEHLLSWLPPFLVRVGELGGDFHRAWADLLGEVLREIAGRGAPGEERPLPAALRDAPPLHDPRRSDEGGSGEAFVKALLAPVRSGLVLGRRDLARAGRDLGLGVRLGERAYTLKALLAQDAPRVLVWLAAEARRQAVGVARSGAPPHIMAFWEARALAAASLLDELTDAGELG